MTFDLPIARRDVIKAAGAGLATGLLTGATAQAQAPAVAQAGGEFWTAEYTAKKGDVSLQIYRKRVSAPAASEAARPVLFLVHGSSNAALSSYDLTVPGKGEYSMMNVYARLGYDVWTMDHEGYGKSSRTSGNSDIASGVEDLRAAAPIVAGETGRSRFHFYGTSSGGIRAAAFAQAQPDRVDRLVLSAVLELDPRGRVLGADFVHGVIRSSHRMTYTEVARLLETRPTSEDERRYGPFLEDFRAMAELAGHLRARREARGSIDFDLPDADVVLDDAGLVVGIVPESRNVAHRLIEEFMLAANEAVARHLLFAKQPAIYRVHDRPDPDRLVDLREVLESFGYQLKGDLEEVPPSAFQKLLHEIEGKSCVRLLLDLL